MLQSNHFSFILERKFFPFGKKIAGACSPLLLKNKEHGVKMATSFALFWQIFHDKKVITNQ